MPLVEELVRRGDRVSYVVNERLAPRLAAVGAEPIGLPYTAPPALDGPVQPDVVENVEIRAWFPQPAVLRRATVFLSHAGMNSTMESLYHGVPLVTVPQDVEQEANAARVEELGAGRQLARADLTPQLLRETVATVVADDDIGARAATCSTALQRCNGPALGADALENHLA